MSLICSTTNSSSHLSPLPSSQTMLLVVLHTQRLKDFTAPLLYFQHPTEASPIPIPSFFLAQGLVTFFSNHKINQTNCSEHVTSLPPPPPLLLPYSHLPFPPSFLPSFPLVPLAEVVTRLSSSNPSAQSHPFLSANMVLWLEYWTKSPKFKFSLTHCETHWVTLEWARWVRGNPPKSQKLCLT